MSEPVTTPPADTAPPADPAPTQTPATPTPADMPPTQPATPPAPQPADAGDADADGGDSTEPDLASLKKLRSEAANWRTKFRDQEKATADALAAAQEAANKATAAEELLSKLSAVLNPDANQPPDPAKLAEDLAAAQAEAQRIAAEKDAQIRDLTVRSALPSALSKNHADPALTEAVLVASGALAKLDPASDTFTTDLESAVAAAVEANPRLKVTPVATRSGAPIPGRSGGDGQLTREQVQEMAKKDPEALVKAQREGRLRGLGIS